MSGVTTATVIAGIGAAAAVGSGISSYIQGQKAQGQAKEANAQNQKDSQTALTAQQNAQNQANARTANSSATAGAPGAGGGGSGVGTMLTGPGGVDPSTLTLGKNTLLGA